MPPNPLLQARIPKPVWDAMERQARKQWLTVSDVARDELVRIFGSKKRAAKSASKRRRS